MKKYTQAFFIIIGLALLLIGIFVIVSNYGLGFGEDTSKTITLIEKPLPGSGKEVRTIEVEPGKDLWDWLGILIIPGTLTIVSVFMSQSQNNANAKLADKHKEIEFELSKKQKALDIKIAKDQQEENNLQTYLDRMSDLLKEGLDDPNHPQQDKLKVVARSRTLTIVEKIEPNRKRSVIQFLYEANLISADKPIISLKGANLENVNLSHLNMENIQLNETNLKYANMRAANLQGANLENSSLQGAQMQAVTLQNSNLREANLRETDLEDANLQYANLRETDLQYANLQGANLHYAHLQGPGLLMSEILELEVKLNEQLKIAMQTDDKNLNAERLKTIEQKKLDIKKGLEKIEIIKLHYALARQDFEQTESRILENHKQYEDELLILGMEIEYISKEIRDVSIEIQVLETAKYREYENRLNEFKTKLEIAETMLETTKTMLADQKQQLNDKRKSYYGTEHGQLKQLAKSKLSSRTILPDGSNYVPPQD